MSEIDGLNSRARYRRLAQECLETARTIQNVETRATLLEMAQIWQPSFPKIQSGGDSRGEAESAHHRMRCLRSSNCSQPS